jgi:DNA polymerase elongation subunit (family B)
MKDPLDYTEDELKAMSKQDLELLIKTAKAKEALFDTEQLALKIMMNALYGAMANKYFPLFNEQMAAAITGNGRYFIQKLAKYIEKTLQDMHKSEKPYLIYGDTDSCVGSTLVKTRQGDIAISDLYDKLNGEIEVRGENNFVKHIKEQFTAASLTKELDLKFNKITYVMKHKVKKRMFKIICNGDEVQITEDHSMMVLRDKNVIEIKPKDVRNTDKLIKIL